MSIGRLSRADEEKLQKIADEVANESEEVGGKKMRERKDLSQEELDALYAHAEEAMKNVGATDVSTKTSSVKAGKFKGECEKGCKDCQPAFCPEDIVTERKKRTYFAEEFMPEPTTDPKDHISRR